MHYKRYIKILIYFILLITLVITSTISPHAFANYTHYYIANKTCDKHNLTNLTQVEQLAYKSATIIADIGRINWDLLYTDSDSYEFKNQMINIANQSDITIKKYIALGWSDHVIHDNLVGTALLNIFKKPQNYYLKCGKLEKYACGRTGIITRKKLLIDHDIIRDTYSKLCNFAPSNKKIDREISKCLFTSILLSIYGLWGLDKPQTIIAEDEFSNLSNLCGIYNRDYDILFNNNSYSAKVS